MTRANQKSTDENALSHGVSRRNFLRLSLALGGASALAGAATPKAYGQAVSASSVNRYPAGAQTFCVMSDLHYFSPSLWKECPDYTTAENSDRKMFRESKGILCKALDDVVAAKPSLVFVPGDLTKDGEYVCHREVAALFADAKRRLETAGVNTKFYVINGNHDLNNHNGLDFSSGKGEPARRTDPHGYREIWGDYGWGDAIARFNEGGFEDGSLSYAARPFKGLTVIGVDTCKYNEPDPDGTGVAQQTSGYVSERLLAWVCDQAQQAKAAGDMVIAVQHHGVVPHFDDEPTFMSPYLVDDYEKVAASYAEAGISVVFTGHMHANDIAAATYGEATIYDIETGSLVTYPSFMRTGSLSYVCDKDQVTANLTVDKHDLGDVAFVGCGLDGQHASITAYGSTRTLTYDSVKTMVSGMAIEPLLGQLVDVGGIKSVLASLLAGIVGDGSPANFTSALWEMLLKMMPTVQENGFYVDLSGIAGSVPGVGSLLPKGIVIWYDEGKEQGSIRFDFVNQRPARACRLRFSNGQIAVLAQGLSAVMDFAALGSGDSGLYITGTAFADFAEDFFASCDASLMSEDGKRNVLEIADMFIDALLRSDVDEKHDVLMLADTAYQLHLVGCEQPEGWLETATAGILDERNLLGAAARDGVNAIMPAKDMAKDDPRRALSASVRVSLDRLFKGSGLLGSVVVKLLPQLVASAFDLLCLMPEEAMGDMVFERLPVRVKQLVESALRTLSHDTNIPEDHRYALSVAAVDPDYSAGVPWAPIEPSQPIKDEGSLVELAPAKKAEGQIPAKLPQTGDGSLVGSVATAAAGFAAVAIGVNASMRQKLIGWFGKRHDSPAGNQD